MYTVYVFTGPFYVSCSHAFLYENFYLLDVFEMLSYAVVQIFDFPREVRTSA